MLSFEIEDSFKNTGYSLICGVDEAGRGPLCGPVFAAAVILPSNFYNSLLNDSKKLSDKQRHCLYEIIIKEAVSYCVAFATTEEIDSLNILNATFLAMRRAVNGLHKSPDLALIDGNRIKGMTIDTQCIVKGDAKSPSIAAASILAKVSRDEYMILLDKRYPQYNIRQHKGYPTVEHYQRIKENGTLGGLYRKSFLKNLEKHI